MNVGFLFLTLFFNLNLLAGELALAQPGRSSVLARAQRDGFLPLDPTKKSMPMRQKGPETKLVPMPFIHLGGVTKKMVYRTTTGKFEKFPVALHLGNISPKRTYLLKPNALYMHKVSSNSSCNEGVCECLVSDIGKRSGFADVIQTVTKEPPYPLVDRQGYQISSESSCLIKLEEGYQSLYDLWVKFSDKELAEVKKDRFVMYDSSIYKEMNQFKETFGLDHFKINKYKAWFAATKEAFFDPNCIDKFFEDIKRLCGNPNLVINEDSYFQVGALRAYVKMDDDELVNTMFNPETGKFLSIDHASLSLNTNIIEELISTKGEEIAALKQASNLEEKNKFWDATLSSMHEQFPIKDEKMLERVQKFLRYFKAVHAAFDVQEANKKYQNIQGMYARHRWHWLDMSMVDENYFQAIKDRAEIIIKDLEGMIKDYNAPREACFGDFCRMSEHLDE